MRTSVGRQSGCATTISTTTTTRVLTLSTMKMMIYNLDTTLWLTSESSQFAYNCSYRPTLSMLQLCLGQGTGQKPCQHLLVLVAVVKEVSTMTWTFPHLKGHRKLDSPLFHHFLKGVCVTHGVIFWGENQGWNNQGAVFEEVHACIKGTLCGLVGDKKIHSGNWNGRWLNDPPLAEAHCYPIHHVIQGTNRQTVKD